MLIPYVWLKDFVGLRQPPEAVARDLSLSTIGVKGISGSGAQAVLDLDITHNRGDLLSVTGVARELAALYQLELKNLGERFKPSTGLESLKVNSDSKLASLYTLTKIVGLSYRSTPKQIGERLEAAGMRSINLWADLTNYLMLEYGQPFHAFDAEKISRRDPTVSIEVRSARKGEKIKTLDGLDRQLTTEDIVIADKVGPIAIAGVMGGEETEVDEGTKEILLEAAIFDPVLIRRTARRLGLRSEASGRFEHFLSPDNLYISLNKILDLYQLYGKGDITAFAATGNGSLEPHSVGLTHEKLAAVAGEAIPLSSARDYLERLGFKVMASEKGLLCWPPHFRGDIRIVEDVIEEVLRLHGYEKIPAKPLQTALDRAGINRLETGRDKITALLAHLGFNEINSFSFVSGESLSHLNPKELLKLRNPVSAEAEYLRPTLALALLEAARKNGSRQARGRIFELGKIYSQNQEVLNLGGLVWGEKQPFLVIKGVLEAIAQELHLTIDFAGGDHPFLHPAEATEIRVGREKIGFLGTIHPHLAEAFDVKGGGIFELDFEKLAELAQSWGTYVSVPPYPEIYEEYSFLLPEKRALGELLKKIGTSSPLVREVEITDRFTTEKGERSITVRVTFQSDEKGLSDDDIRPIREKIQSQIRHGGGTLRA